MTPVHIYEPCCGSSRFTAIRRTRRNSIATIATSTPLLCSASRACETSGSVTSLRCLTSRSPPITWSRIPISTAARSWRPPRLLPRWQRRWPTCRNSRRGASRSCFASTRTSLRQPILRTVHSSRLKPSAFASMDAFPVKSADRTLDIFELLVAEPNGLTISEISDRLGFARSSTRGLVHTLQTRGYLALDGGRRFQLGARLIQLGLNVVDRLELRSAAREPMERLVQLTHDTALLATPDRGELLYVEKILSDTRDVRTDPRVSSKRPLHCSSLGKALLAALDDQAVMKVIDLIGLERVTQFSITNRDRLLDDLARTRARGYSVDQQEALVGVWCVGAPVRDHTGRSVAAISLSTIKDFFDPDQTGPQVAAAAVEVSRAMGWTGDASTLYHPVPGSELFLLDHEPLHSSGHQ